MGTWEVSEKAKVIVIINLAIPLLKLGIHSHALVIRSVDLDNWFPWIAVMFRFLDYFTSRSLRLQFVPSINTSRSL